ncbi:MAG: riboflavin synthase [Alphaproteobacteria bacterium]
MFTGIITHTGTITDIAKHGDVRIAIACPFADDLSIGDSVAVNGCCLTVVEKVAGGFTADISQETLSCTAPRWNKGDLVNLERSLKLGDRLDGHLVTGHVDSVAAIASMIESGGSQILTLEVPAAFSRFIAAKGSVTLDGISLTVNKVESNRLWVNIIPHTWQHTTLKHRKIGDTLNLEIDIMARYAERLLKS